MDGAKRKGLSSKLTKIVVSIALVIGISLNLVQIILDFLSEEERAEKIVSQIVESVLPTASEIAYKLDQEGAVEFVNGLLKYDFIIEAAIEDDTGEVLARKSAEITEDSPTIWITDGFVGAYTDKKFPLFRGHRDYAYGFLLIKINNDRMFQKLYQRSVNIFLTGLARNLFLSFVLLVVFYFFLTKPLLKIASFFSSLHPEKDSGARLDFEKNHQHDEMGEIIERINTFLDEKDKYLDELNRAQQNIREQSEFQHSIMTTTLEGFVLLDSEGNIKDTNPRFTEIVQCSLEDTKGKNIGDFLDQANTEKLFDHLKQDQSGETLTLALRTFKEENQSIPCLFCVTPLRYRQGTDESYFAFITDISEMVKTQEEKKRIENELFQMRKMESLGTLAGGIAHDFNNMLAAVMGFAEIALEDIGENAKGADEIREVLLAAQRGKTLVQQILSFSRQSVRESVVINCSIFIEEAVKIIHSTLPSHITIDLQINRSNLNIEVDPVQFQQVLINLSTNAAHAIGTKDGTITIKLDSADQDIVDSFPQSKLEENYLYLEITDTGDGIDDSVVDRIFDPFFTTKNIGEGTGMGLAIVHGIVGEWQGWITVKSTPGEGTIFTLYIPVVNKAAIRSEENVQVSGGDEKILFVDDEKAIGRSATANLTSLGYSVDTFSSPFEALKHFRKESEVYDLVITDYTMPGMNGLDFAENIAQLHSGIKIILLTGYSSNINKERIVEAGLDGYALKPLTKDDLAVIVRKVLDGNSVV